MTSEAPRDPSSDPSVEEDLDKYGDPAHWQALCPGLHIDDEALLSQDEPLPIDDATVGSVNELLLSEAYFQLPPQPFGLDLSLLARAVMAISADGWPTPFAFLFDEFWLLFARLRRLLAGVLGPDYLMLPDFWAWHVDHTRGEAGWAPHRDKGRVALFPDGRPKSLTVWLPLTEAMPLNGCMYVLPRDRDVAYNTPDEDGECQVPYQSLRALPAQAGSVLGWTQAILHWGGGSSPRAPHPRISCAFEFQRGDVPHFNEPVLPPDIAPCFEERWVLVSKQILQYKHMYPLAPRVQRLAERVIKDFLAAVAQAQAAQGGLPAAPPPSPR